MHRNHRGELAGFSMDAGPGNGTEPARAHEMPTPFARVADLERENQAMRERITALEQDGALLRGLIDAAGHVVRVVQGHPHRVVHCSASFETVWGYRAEALCRDPDLWLRCLHADDRERVHDSFQQWLGQRTRSWEAEFRIARADRTVRWIHERGLLLNDSDGHVRALVLSSDVTGQRVTEAALRESEERFALAVAGCNDGIWHWDIATGLQYYSARAQRIYGLTPGPTTRHRSEWRRLVPVHPDDYHEQINAVTDFLAGSASTYGGEWRILLPDGGYKWIRLHGACVRDAAGLPIRLAGSISDIDAAKREQASRQQSQRLEAVGTLAGGIAHDFNNILGAILGFGEMSLQRSRRGSRMHRDLECIVTAGERGRILVDRILAFSRSSVSERVPVHVEKVVREAVTLLAPTLHRNVRLECHLQAGTAAILGDPTQIHQVVANLATNAVQAMAEGGALTIRLECLLLTDTRVVANGSVSPGPYLLLTVSDTGSGIAPTDRHRIFDPFFSTKEVNVGTGLGLSLVHGIVSELGGAIDVASTVGEGSTFAVYLPRSGDVAQPRALSQQNLPRGNLQRILVVDDDPGLARLTSQRCADLGYQWMACTASTEAIRAFRNNPDHFDLVLTDERMPGLSGTALIRLIREVRSDIPIIMMSGYLGDDLVHRAGALGATQVMAKPVSKADLAAALSKALPRPLDGTGNRRRTMVARRSGVNVPELAHAT